MSHVASPSVPGLVAALVVALASCDREPRLPAERAEAVREARSDVASAEQKLARADRPSDVAGASQELTTAAAEFHQRRDAAIASTRATLDQVDRDIRQIVDVRAETEFQDKHEGPRTDAAIKELVSVRAELEATLQLMQVATVDTWPPLETRVNALTTRIRAARQQALDGLY